MNEETYEALKVYKPHLECWAKQDNVQSGVLNAINHIHKLIFPSSKPTNMSCYSCVNDMMHTMINVLRSYESTISK